MSVFAWGANSYGQLGLGHQTDIYEPSKLCLDQLPTSLHAGGGHTVAIYDAIGCFSCGSNNKGQLGNGLKADFCTEWTEVKIPGQSIKDAALGWDYTFFITDHGQCYASGANSYGQLGLGADNAPIISPQEVYINGPVRQIACGLRHTLVLTGDGRIFSSGSARNGQLGRPVSAELKFSSKFQEVILPKSLSRITSIAAGAYHSAAVSSSGQVVMWGDNKRGQLALPAEVPSHASAVLPTPLLQYTIHKLSSGWTHLTAITDTGSVLSWGRADYGQLGRAVTGSFDVCPEVVALPMPVSELAAGSEHNLAVTASGDCYSWGWNEHGMCGTGDDLNVTTPLAVTKLETLTVDKLTCGAAHNFVISQHKHT